MPALSDCSAGFGIVLHQSRAEREGRGSAALDSGRDFLELTRIKLASRATGLLMLGGGVPKNFAQDIVVAAEMLDEADGGAAGQAIPEEVSMHRYAVQLTVADSRDGALSGSTLREATSWGKVDTVREQMVFCEATLGFSLLASDAWHRRAWEGRRERRFAEWLEENAARGDAAQEPATGAGGAMEAPVARGARMKGGEPPTTPSRSPQQPSATGRRR